MIRYLVFCLLLSLFCSSCFGKFDSASRPTQFSDKKITLNKPSLRSKTSVYLEELGFVRILDIDNSIHIDLKYSTKDNFTGQILYADLKDAYLHPFAAEKLKQAQMLLKEYNSKYSLLVYDAARPLSVQRAMYDVVKNTKYHLYVANPSKTGLHNYGVAVDLTICDENGSAIDMGTAFDYFGKAAGINQEDELLVSGVLTKSQVFNRRLLRDIMTKSGFIPIRGEWWHFNAMPLWEAKKKSQLIE